MRLKNLGPDDLPPRAKDVAELIAGYVGGERDARVDPTPSCHALERALAAARRRGKRRRVSTALTCAAALVGAGFGVRALVDRRHPSLSYTVDPFVPGPGQAVAPPTSPQMQFSFSDGTRIQMAAGARGRVAGVSRGGARFVLDQGRAHVHVVHRPGAEWSFAAGPFSIEVHGTVFSLDWSAERGWLNLKMESGVVSVRGPLSGGRVVLRAGESLSAVAPPKGSQPAAASLSSSPPPPPAESAIAPPAGLVEHRAATAPAARPRPAAAASTSNWPQDLDQDRAGVIVADAERRGLDRVLRDSGSEELSALADAARYKRRYALARQVLLVQMRRFPSSSRARDASFFLGRLSEEARDGQEEALEFYDRYLRETPNGTYASEALGRKMMMLERSHRERDARGIAGDYLRRYPKGTYAHAARVLTRLP